MNMHKDDKQSGMGAEEEVRTGQGERTNQGENMTDSTGVDSK